MKKMLILLLSLVLLITVAGCGSDEAPKETAKDTDKPVERVKEEKGTKAQQNAVGKAKEYISIMAFSKDGLVKQLEFDKFETADAEYAVENITVDWKEQAVKKGEDYLDIMSHSRQGLIDQLKFDGFTDEEATYAVDEIGL